MYKWLLLATAAIGLAGCVEDSLRLTIRGREAYLTNIGLEPVTIEGITINGRDECQLVKRPREPLKTGEVAYITTFQTTCLLIVRVDIRTPQGAVSFNVGDVRY